MRSVCDPLPDCDPLPERDPLPELPDPLIPLDPLVLPGDRDEFWSFLFRSFAIKSSRLEGRPDEATSPARSNASAVNRSWQHSRHFSHPTTTEYERIFVMCLPADICMGAHTIRAANAPYLRAPILPLRYSQCRYREKREENHSAGSRNRHWNRRLS